MGFAYYADPPHDAVRQGNRMNEEWSGRDGERCATGKRVYFKPHLANRAITEAAKRGELPTMRHYPCPQCGWWHLSRKNRSLGRIVASSDGNSA